MTDQQTTQTTNTFERVIGFDSHPDSFTAALVRGPTPAAAVVEKTCHKLAMNQLQNWAKKNTTQKDLFVLEASGNSFQVVRTLATLGRQAKVLESCHLGKLKEAHANNDKISAVRIAKAYLAGTAKEVWVPDPKTQERRDWFHAHRKATKRLTQMRARLRSYLSDNGVRLPKAMPLTQNPEAAERIRRAREWSGRQWQVIEIFLQDLEHADTQRRHWRSLIAQEVLSDPALVQLVRLCGVREMTAFALQAFIGNIQRFDHPKKLVKYVGLNPAFDDSGASEWEGGIGGHGNKHLRCLLIEGAQSILRAKASSLAQWGRKLLAKKGCRNLAVAAVARKLTVAVWYLMMGRWTPLEEIDDRLCVKVTHILGNVGLNALKQMGQTRPGLRAQVYELLKSVKLPPAPAQDKPEPQAKAQLPQAKVYVLGPSRKKRTRKAEPLEAQPSPA